jgi:chromosome segregation ATPase
LLETFGSVHRRSGGVAGRQFGARRGEAKVLRKGEFALVEAKRGLLELEEVKTELEDVKRNLAAKEGKLEQTLSKLTDAKRELTEKGEELKQANSELVALRALISGDWEGSGGLSQQVADISDALQKATTRISEPKQGMAEKDEKIEQLTSKQEQ